MIEYRPLRHVPTQELDDVISGASDADLATWAHGHDVASLVRELPLELMIDMADELYMRASEQETQPIDTCGKL